MPPAAWLHAIRIDSYYFSNIIYFTTSQATFHLKETVLFTFIIFVCLSGSEFNDKVNNDSLRQMFYRLFY